MDEKMTLEGIELWWDNRPEGERPIFGHWEDVTNWLIQRVKELEESDSWMLSAKEFLENGGCPICFTTDEAGHTKECVWGQTEMKVKGLVGGLSR